MIQEKEYKYIMEDAREADRLASKVDSEDFVQKYLAHHIHDTCRHILDIGCGPAVIASKLGNMYPHVAVRGIDISPVRVTQAHERPIPSNVQILQASALDIPFADESFDLLNCRFLLEYLKEKQKALNEMYRVCRPGGIVILQDLDGQLVSNYPEAPFNTDLQKVIQYLANTGFDPYVGRKLYSLTFTAGFNIEDVKVEPYHLMAGTVNQTVFDLWNLKLDIALPQISKALGSDDKAVDFKNQYLNYLQDEKTFSYSTLFTVVGYKK